ncbi:diacylglycerol/lipid kinase family protein [Streptomyces sp. CA-181903]|uniref:diacylglycerol/lipid kinase family protein n=1 Tax=Streptomyces sp. CA-181903 TaxID=3240055 RepID=UPI003D936683
MSRTVLVIVNPAATRAGRVDVDAVVRSLAGAGGTVDVAVTGGPAHATELAREARRRGVRLVVAVGGDGTVNEVANGLLADAPADGPTGRPAGGVPAGAPAHGLPAHGPADGVPVLGILPAGAMNVVGRSLGVSTSPPGAVRQLAAAVRTGRRTLVNVGRVNARFFLFASGAGFGAELMSRMAAARRRSGRTSVIRALAEGVRVFPRGACPRRQALRITGGGSERQALALLVANASPTPTWAVGPQPVPGRRLGQGLGGAGVHRFVPPALRLPAGPHARGTPARARGTAGGAVLRRHEPVGHLAVPHRAARGRRTAAPCRALSFHSVRQALAIAL